MSKHAFTLLELSVVIAVVALVVGSGIAIQNKATARNAITVTHERMQLLTQAIDDYVDHHGFLPCPADPTDTFIDATFGIGFGTSGTNCTSDNLAGSATVPAGFVPVHTLNIPPVWAIDGWNNRITYVVDEDLVQQGNGTDPTNGTAGTGYTASDAAGSIEMLNSNTTQNFQDEVAVVLISHGENRFGSWPLAGGSRFNATGGSTSEDENTDADGVFNLTALSVPNDDIVYFLTKWHIDAEWRE